MMHDDTTLAIDGTAFRLSACIGAGLAADGSVGVDTGVGRSHPSHGVEPEPGETAPDVTTDAGGAVCSTIEGGSDIPATWARKR